MLKWERLQDAIKNIDQWQSLSGHYSGPCTWRAKVPGGWLVRFGWQDASGDSHPMIFYPDLNHEWTGSSLE